MFQNAARQYWRLKAQVGDEAGIKGMGCRIAPTFVLTAMHVVQGVKSGKAILDDGLWRWSLNRTWPQRDLALLELVDCTKPICGADPAATTFPSIADAQPFLGQSLGYLAHLSLRDEYGERSSHTYFGHGHVAFFKTGDAGEILFALGGGAIQRGFSGGPVFEPNGRIVGVLVQSLQYMPNLDHPLQGPSTLALFSPVAPIAVELTQLS